MKTTDYDVLIIGGGLVGASLACALSGQGLRMGIIEAVPFGQEAQPSYDDRVIALAQGTQRILASMGVWHYMAAGVTPIHHIHVSDRGRFGFTHLDRQQEGVDALGYVAPARVLGQALNQYLQAQAGIDFITPAELDSFDIYDDYAEVRVRCDDDIRVFSTRLVVAADGSDSLVRQQADIEVTEWAYGQTAIITNVTPQLAHNNIAYERFTDTGPLALLPMEDQRCALVWTVKDDQLDEVMALSDEPFLQRLQDRFGYRLGEFQQVGARHAYPLSMRHAQESVRPRLALIGNAVHTLHPLAGQGFNLGLRDVAALAEVLVDVIRSGGDVGDLMHLQDYEAWRAQDHKQVIAFTDGLLRLFTNPLASVALVRNVGMVGMDMLPPLKRLLTRLTMGQSGRMSRLARGLGLGEK
ncbi:MAG: 2-octaprenyl-6-methoxyphenyl hydroxylase [Gammaproteobacteria bacterium]|nr:2-octaprenyl-6-methoxyphenyl hydroxylase [Gammaproteobacteria bacterium]